MIENVEQELREIEADAFHIACFIDAMEEKEECFHITYSEDDEIIRMYTTDEKHKTFNIIQGKEDKIEKLTIPIEEIKKANDRFINLGGTFRA
jgi:carotenoid cleavage dioxygenase-like enzyme